MSNTKNTNLFRRLMCLGLILILLLGIVGCDSNPATTGPSQSLEGSTAAPTQPTQPPTEPTTAPTEPTTEPTETPTEPTQPATEPTQPTTEPTEPPTQPTEPTPPPVDPNALVYELTQEDVDEFYRLLAECEALALAGEDMDAIEASSDALDLQYERLIAQHSISMILHYSDTLDKTLEQQYLDCDKIYTQTNNDYIQMVRRIYQSESPAKEKLFEDWTEQDIAQLLAYEEEIALLRERNTEIKVAYNASALDEIRIPLYIEFVQNNNKIAQIFGYENYYTYAYSLVYNRDYTTEDLELMRQYTQTHLAGALDTALNNFYNSFGGLTVVKQNSIIDFLYNDYTTLTADYVGKYLSVMPESMQTEVNNMLTADSLFATSSSATPTAFTTMIGDRSYCFFGPGYTNSCTVIHEAGHYYASRYADLNSIPLDLGETHSQGNEWLFMQNLMGKMPVDQYEALLDYRLFYDMAMIMICLMVDEFEQQVYSTDISDFTAADFDAIMDAVCQKYCTLEYAATNLTDLHFYWRAVVVDQPVYYISYAVSSVAALDLFTMAQEDFDTAVTIYQTLCEQPQEDQGFLGNISAAGLNGPFQETFYIEIVEYINSRT